MGLDVSHSCSTTFVRNFGVFFDLGIDKSAILQSWLLIKKIWNRKLKEKYLLLYSWGWLFTAEKFWTSQRIQSYLSGVPNDHMMILDLFSEQWYFWEKSNFYGGKKFIWNTLHNFGGNEGKHKHNLWILLSHLIFICFFY